MTSRFRPLPDDWYRWVDTAGAGRPSVDVQVSEGADGRLHLSGLRIDGPVSAGGLRAVPVGRIEAAANAQLHHRSPDVPRRRPRAAIPSSLRVRAGRSYPDRFYEAVASAYRYLVTASATPVVDLAAANQVPVTTAQRWVKEARRRGLLVRGQPGKSG